MAVDDAQVTDDARQHLQFARVQQVGDGAPGEGAHFIP
jgi:hypothetical protein